MRVVSAMPTLLRVAVAQMTAYRAEMIIWILTATLPLVMLALWNAAAADGPMKGFGQAEFARYFTVTLVVRQLTSAWVVWELNDMIRRGSLSPALLRPLNPLWLQFATTLAAVPWRILVLTPILAVLAFWRPDVVFVPTLAMAAAFALSVVLALLLTWGVQCLFGMLAFWMDQSYGLFQVYFFIWGLLGGYIVPLPLLPPQVADVARWLPFHASLGAPVGIALGVVPIGPTLAVQAAWVLIVAITARLVWNRGLRRYGAVGA